MFELYHWDSRNCVLLIQTYVWGKVPAERSERMPKDMNVRACGSCTACCKTHGVRSLDKPENVWCTSCAIGVGCERYDTRPTDCRDFSCVWLIGEGAENDRPDKNKVVIGVDDMQELGDTVTIHELRSGAFEASALAQEWVRKGIGLRMPVWIRRLGARDKLLLPPTAELSNAIKTELRERNVAVHRYHFLA